MQRVFLILFFIAGITACRNGYEMETQKGNHEVIKSQGKDSLSEAFIFPYRDSISKQMDEVIGISEVEMKTGHPESLLGNFICDALYHHYKNEFGKNSDSLTPLFVLLNERGLRAPLPKGSIRVGDIYKIMPFENSIVLVKLKGSVLQDMANALIDYGGHPVSSNFRLLIEKDSSYTLTIDNRVIDTSSIYSIITTDYLANGGDHMDFFKKAVRKKEINYKLRDFILYHIRKCTEEGKKIIALSDGRIFFK